MDYDLETQAILRALKEGQQLADTPINLPMVGEGRGVKFMSGPSPAGIDRMLGQYQISQAEERQRKMNEQQQGEYDALQRELMTEGPKTRSVLKQTLRQGEGPLLEPNFDQQQVEEVIPETERAIAENARRMGIAQKMSRLPMAKAAAEKLWAKGVDFPDKLRELEIKQIDAGANKAEDRLLKQALTGLVIAGQDRRNTENNQMRITLKGMGGDGSGESVSFQQKGYTPEGEVVGYNPKTNRLEVNGKPYVGEISSGSDFSKAGGKRRDLNGAIADSDALIKKVEGSPEAFGVTPSVASMLPNVIGSRLTSKVLTPEQNDARRAVAQEAAVVINDIYGAALSMGESARANSWAWNPTDDYDTTLSKLRQAKSWAGKNLNRTGIIKSSGGGGGAAPKPASWISDDDLLKKYGNK